MKFEDTAASSLVSYERILNFNLYEISMQNSCALDCSKTAACYSFQFGEGGCSLGTIN